MGFGVAVGETEDDGAGDGSRWGVWPCPAVGWPRWAWVPLAPIKATIASARAASAMTPRVTRCLLTAEVSPTLELLSRLSHHGR